MIHRHSKHKNMSIVSENTLYLSIKNEVLSLNVHWTQDIKIDTDTESPENSKSGQKYLGKDLFVGI